MVFRNVLSHCVSAAQERYFERNCLSAWLNLRHNISARTLQMYNVVVQAQWAGCIAQQNTRHSPNPMALRTKFCIPRPSFLWRLLVTSSMEELSSCFTCKQWQGKWTFMLYVVRCPCSNGNCNGTILSYRGYCHLAKNTSTQCDTHLSSASI